MIRKCSKCKKDYEDGWGSLEVHPRRYECYRCADTEVVVAKKEFERAFGKVSK